MSLFSHAIGRGVFFSSALAVAVSFAVRAEAAVVQCTDSAGAAQTLTDPIIVAGSSAVQTLIQTMSPVLASAANPIYIVYQKGGSCAGVDAIVAGTALTGTGSHYASSGTWTCTLDGLNADIGVSDVFAQSCPGNPTLTNDIGDFWGPVQSMTLAVPRDSIYNSISAEAAYLTFGFGQDGQTDWSDPTLYHVRNSASGTQTMIGLAIHVPAGSWIGKDEGSSGNVQNALSSPAGDVNKTIGILASNEADNARATIKILAYQDYDQTCGYWPDSSRTSFDKLNVRIGRYPIWGPLHLLAKATKSGTTQTATNAQVAEVVSYIALEKELPGAPTAVIDAELAANTTPGCAMRVRRTEDLEPLESYLPPNPCGCYFDAKKNPDGTTCKPCTNSADCQGTASPVCRFGYCEVQ
jgi:ABC-type phosphate transport system substrate-binding protein